MPSACKPLRRVVVRPGWGGGVWPRDAMRKQARRGRPYHKSCVCSRSTTCSPPSRRWAGESTCDKEGSADRQGNFLVALVQFRVVFPPLWDCWTGHLVGEVWVGGRMEDTDVVGTGDRCSTWYKPPTLKSAL